MKKRTQKGFTLIELLVVIAIIGVLSAVIGVSAAKSRSYGRDAQVQTDKGVLELAIERASAADPSDKYPGTAGTWYCLKTSGTCLRGGASANTAVNTALAPYLSGGSYPTPPLSKSGEYRFDSYVYTPANSTLISGYNGPLLLWWQESPISASDCNGYNAGALDTGVYYCYEKIVK